MTLTSKGEQLTDLTEHWWLVLLEGLAFVLIGWWILTRPISTTLILVQVLGLYWLIVGIIDIVVSLFDKNTEARGWKLFGGIIGIIAGLFVLNNPIFTGVLTPNIMLWIIAFAFLINGVIKVFLGNKQVQDLGGFKWSWGQFFIGILYVLFGIALLAMSPAASFATMVLTTGILAIIGGIGLVIFSFTLKGAKN
jgi:uncharacterized membrane protein HdeD (DUF308 family)